MDPRLTVLLTLVAMVLLLLSLLKWAFGRGRSTVTPRREPGPGPDDYVPVAVVPTFIEAEVLLLELREAGVQAEVGRQGARAEVLVRLRHLEAARTVLNGPERT